MKSLLTTGQAARLCAVTPDTVLKWIKSGRVEAERTPGGHYRLRRSDVEELRHRQWAGFRFCWEFNAKKGELLPACRDCLVYRAGALRCYELASAIGHSQQFCGKSCDECEYFRLQTDRPRNVLVVTEQEGLRAQVPVERAGRGIELVVTDSEYSLSNLVGSFRPDIVVIDCGLGPKRAERIARHLLADARARLQVIIFAAKEGEFPADFDPRIFLRVGRPIRMRDIVATLDAGQREQGAGTLSGTFGQARRKLRGGDVRH